MRKLTALATALVVMTLGTGGKLDKLESYERDHYQALEVWFKDNKEKKAYLKLKTPAERDQWLKDMGYWDRFYKYDEYDQKAILSREPKVGWTQDMVYMAWGPPYTKVKSTKRTAQESMILKYRLEVTKDGEHMIWEPGSKETYKAVRRYQTDLYLDDRKVVEIVQKEEWEQ
ncbi:MAG: hypothetical protein H6737_00700 [Alphaproteobacteria bacterium]|nr:hypothetical protein [Alphaproteobacteria bacterium]